MKTLWTVDVAAITEDEQVLLIRRAHAPFTDRLVLPGGHVDAEDGSFVEAAARELREETGLIVDAESLHFLTVLDAPGRDPRPEPRISVVFAVRISDEQRRGARAASDAVALVWRPLAALTEDELGFDHWKVISLLKGERS
jgi:8-oxo-dGTP diphosphatase